MLLDGSLPADASLTVSPERVIGDFGARTAITRRGVQSLVGSLARCRAADALLHQWCEFFRKTCGRDWPRPKARLDRLARLYGIAHDAARPEVVLFAAQSWYVLLVKLLVAHALACVRGKGSPAEEATGGDARAVVAALEDGRIFCDLAATDPWPGEPFGWLARAWTDDLERAATEAARRIAAYDPAAVIGCAADGGDLLKPLYEALFPRTVRHALGEFYTPGWLAEHVLDQVGYFGQLDARLLDPTCGSGTFLLAALRRWRVGSDQRAQARAGSPSARVGGPALASSLASPYAKLPIVGFDLHPLAVASARANYLLAIADLIVADEFVEIPVFARDCLLDPWPEDAGFDFVVGNPPWIAWDNLPADYREATKAYWQQYGLFSLSGNEARHGGGKKDLSMLVLYAAADRHLRARGRVGMVITQTLFQSKGAGDGFRRFRIGNDGPPLAVVRVDDLVAVRPFDAANWTSVVVLQKGDVTKYPVPYVKWKPGESGQPLPSAIRAEMFARPVDAARATSPWIISVEKTATEPVALGRADYTAHLGANSGGANAVYWLQIEGKTEQGIRVRNRAEKAKRAAARVEAIVEPDLLYPLVRWSDVARWSARPSAYLLLAQDPATRAGIDETRMRRDFPLTFEYLKQFEPLLTGRAAYRRYQGRQPFYSMYNVGPYTLATAKVIWRRMDREIRAAVVETIDDPHLGLRPVAPQETCVLIACSCGDEAHYLCAVLNSSSVHDLVSAHSVVGGKGFGTPSILDYVPLKQFDPADARHGELAAISRRMHAAALAGEVLGDEQEGIDCMAARALAAGSPAGGR